MKLKDKTNTQLQEFFESVGYYDKNFLIFPKNFE